MEEAGAIKKAQMAARKFFEIPTSEKVDAKKAQGKAAACSKGHGETSTPSGATEGAMARWLARTAVKG